jgi:mRNA interferase YafQ
MTLKLVATSQFRRDLKTIKKRGLDITALEDVLTRLCAEETFGERLRDHALVGNYAGFRECHIKPDWLLVYAIDNDKLILTASRTGTHSDLFNN